MKTFIPLRSKVSRRIVVLFVFCALLPVTILAVVSFYEVSEQLRESSERQLAWASRNLGMEIYERIEIGNADLQVVSLQLRNQPSLGMGPGAHNHFTSLGAYSKRGKLLSEWGAALPFPQLTPAEIAHLESAKPLLQITINGEGRTSIGLLRMSDPTEADPFFVLGELDPHYLWSTQGVPAGVQLAVLTAQQDLLFSSSDKAAECAKALPELQHASGSFQARGGNNLYDAAYWKLLVKPQFFQDAWTIVVSQEHAATLEPMLNFRRTFPLVILLSLWIVLLFSMIQVRRTLVPLERLNEGTRQIAAQKFDSRVEVHSGDEFEGLAFSFNAMAAQLGRQFGALKTINEINHAIFASLDREAIVDGALEHMPSLLSWKLFGVCLFDETRSSGWIRYREIRRAGAHTESSEVGPIDWLQLQNNPQAFVVTRGQRIPEYLLPMSKAGVETYLVLPVRVENTIRGVLVCGEGAGEGLDLEEVKEARQVADQLAIALSHVQLITTLEQLHWGTLRALARAIDAKSQWTAGHSERVTNLAMDIGRRMGLPEKDLKIIHMGGLLHDIGKIGTPPEILDKPGKLTAEEMRVMQDHVRIGVRILEPVPGLKEALPVVAQHHEWFNGGGYPAGVAGNSITVHARIAAVADCYDALTSDRPYRKGLPKEQIKAMLREKSGSQFDPEVITAFFELMAERAATPADSAAASAGRAG